MARRCGRRRAIRRAAWPALGVLLAAPTAQAAPSLWAVTAANGAIGQGAAATLPAAPGNVTADCGLVALSIKVSWSATPQASTYTVYQATAASGPFTVAASGVTATSWNSAALSIGSYWYQVAAVSGSAWTGPNSPTTQGHSITAAVCT